MKHDYRIIPVFISVVILLGFVLLPVSVWAQDSSGGQNQENQELLAKIEAELKIIEAKVQLIEKAIRIVNENNPPFLISFSRGYWGFEVKELQEVLSQDPAIYPEGFVTGYFGSLTEAAVKIFQTRYGLESTGFVGPKTKEKLCQYILDSVVLAPKPLVSPEPLVPSASPLAEPSTSPSPSPTVSATPSPSPSVSATPSSSPAISTTGSGYVPPSAPSPSPSSSPSPMSCATPVASSLQTYYVTTRNMPRITQVDIDPLDVWLGATQTVTAKVRDTNDSPITSVAGTVQTDGSPVNFSFSLTAGNDLDGTWQGSWSPQDSLCNNYMITIIAISASGQSKVDLSIR